MKGKHDRDWKMSRSCRQSFLFTIFYKESFKPSKVSLPPLQFMFRSSITLNLFLNVWGCCCFQISTQIDEIFFSLLSRNYRFFLQHSIQISLPLIKFSNWQLWKISTFEQKPCHSFLDWKHFRCLIKEESRLNEFFSLWREIFRFFTAGKTGRMCEGARERKAKIKIFYRTKNISKGFYGNIRH